MLKVPNVSFNMLQQAVVGPMGNKFLKDCRAAKRAVFLWTVNEERWMRWSIGKGVDGVITDDPKKYLEICDSYDENAPPYRWSLRDYGVAVYFNVMIIVFGTLFGVKYGFRVNSKKIEKEMRDSKLSASKLA
jgi:phosphatidylglycerol phospholipase C